MLNTLTHHQQIMEKRLHVYHQLSETNLRTSADNWRLAGLIEQAEKILDKESKSRLKKTKKA